MNLIFIVGLPFPSHILLLAKYGCVVLWCYVKCFSLTALVSLFCKVSTNSCIQALMMLLLSTNLASRGQTLFCTERKKYCLAISVVLVRCLYFQYQLQLFILLNLHFSFSFSNLSGCNCVLALVIVISIVEVTFQFQLQFNY